MLDFHTHSTASDGSDSPSALLHAADRLGLTAVALTDHDTVSGLAEFLDAARGRSIVAVPGVELSTMLYHKEIHILGLFVDPASESLNAFLEAARVNRNLRNRTMLEKLNAIGYQITLEELYRQARGESIGRPHVAEILVEKGYFHDVQEAFDRCLKRGARAYTPRQLPQPAECIEAIHAAGGLAFWAHPVHGVRSERAMVRRFLKVLVPAGLDGLEAYYSIFTPAQSAMLEDMAREFQILRTGGTDYHGSVHAGIGLGTGRGGLSVPDELLDAMRRKLADRSCV